MRDIETLLAVLVAEPQDKLAWLALADALEENNRQSEGELTRLRQELLGLDSQTSSRKPLERRVQRLLLDGAKPVVPTCSVELSHEVSMTFVFIPPGSFLMGSPETEKGRYSDEGPQHTVEFRKGLWMAQTPTTQQQYQALVGVNPSHYVGRLQPVESVTWFDVEKFANTLSEKIRRRVRMPSEAEWEYACRAGTQSAYNVGPKISYLKKGGWFNANTGLSTVDVGQLVPNAWGLYDMHGNVREWCLDIDHTYPRETRIDPIVLGSGERMMRGGSWYSSPRMCRSAFRFTMAPVSAGHGYGFRLVMEVE
jgi:uncharacterized protein (TIGR02996 family)